MTIRIAMWSGPRNLSTAMMRSFGSRADTIVSDEPFYGAYMKHTGDIQPMREAILAMMDCNWQSVARDQNGPPPEPRPIWYQKQMAHHMAGPISIADLHTHVHAFLIRDPRRVVASYAAKRVSVLPEHLGVARQRQYFDREADRLGHAPPVVDSADILANPPVMLAALCTSLGIAWDAAMLQWRPGRRSTDGIWGRHWYDAVEASTGFGPPESGNPQLDAAAQAVAAACADDYAYLAAHRLRA
jgi:hypothetical protein